MISELHHRRSIRLKNFNYAQIGAYFVTLCTYNQECSFGNVIDGKMVLNDAGRIAVDEWKKSAIIRNEIELDEFIVMPNHIHGIVIIVKSCRGDRPVAPTKPIATMNKYKPNGPPPKSIGSLIAGFKSAVTKGINENRGTPGMPVWQRNYYEHIIRNKNELHRIRQYIRQNPERWGLDGEI
jgi:putative transposase